MKTLCIYLYVFIYIYIHHISNYVVGHVAVCK
jgi:hypothetical protein